MSREFLDVCLPESHFLDPYCGGKSRAGVADAAKGLQARRGGREDGHCLGSLVHRAVYGVLVGSTKENGRKVEVIRLAPGDYFGRSDCSLVSH